ncbi:MAG: PP2C family protein-serine/threonine phosphatase [Acidobacteriota bacterium]|nr:PP2C family protein-serine/threonine phosphatase [Acidobacteriota bacterium]
MSVTELIGTAIACTLLALGLASMAAWGIRRRSADRLLLLFGLWCVLYGIRLVAEQPAITLALGGSARTWDDVVAIVTYVINVPTVLFLEALIGPGWKQSIRRLWQVQGAYGVAAIVIDLFTYPNAAMGPNRVLVLLGVVVAALNVRAYRRRLGPMFKTPIVAFGVLTLVLFVLNENLGRPIMPAVDLEPVGVLIFVTALAYGVVGTVFRSETELLTVQRELETARQIQMSLLPRTPPRVRGLDVAVRYLPMTAVAGDLYDFVELGDGRVGILVADVSGHGIPAALVASMVKLAFTTQARHAHDPARVLTAMNAALAGQLERGFVTAVYAVIDTGRRTMTAANAGHPPLLVGRADRGVEELSAHGLMLGVVPDASYTNTELELLAGDRILFYTDGVTEARNPEDEFFDDDRVKAWLTSAGEPEAGPLADAALDALARWRGRETFEDDVTFVIARVAPA